MIKLGIVQWKNQMCIYEFMRKCWVGFLVQMVQQKPLTSTPRPLTPPAPHPIGQALDVGRTNTVVPWIASEDYPSSILIVRTVDDLPFSVVQREGAETRAHDDCKKSNGGLGYLAGNGHCQF